MPVKHFIVKRGQTLFLMRSDDFRFGTYEYATITTATSMKQKQRHANGHVMKLYHGADARTYGVFSDWSAMAMKGGA